MGKRLRQCSVCHKLQGESQLEDRISQLPDGILVQILSLLPITEAGRSSMLSPRWRDLWKSTTGLDFDAYGELKKLYIGKSRDSGRSKFVAFVNRVLKLHQRPSLDEFRVSCSLKVEASHDIDEWFNFALSKRVRRLEIDLVPICPVKPFTLAHECYLRFKNPSNLCNIKCLTSLSLGGVNVNEELLEHCLSNCPHLERLRVVWSDHILNVKVIGPSLQLKHLEIARCKLLESLEVCAPKLVTFKYFGQNLRLSIGTLPLLDELNIGGENGHRISRTLSPFSSNLSQIQTLELKSFSEEVYKEILQVPELTNLKHLILHIIVGHGRSLLHLTSLIEAAPSLRKFTLELGIWGCYEPRWEQLKLTRHPHQYLKEMEIFGFVGMNCDVELVKYVLKNAINLGKIIIDPYPFGYTYRKGSEKIEVARKRAHKLGKKLRPGVEFIVL